MVAKIVGFKGMRENEKARDSVKKEYDSLRSFPIWNESKIRELADVMDEARKTGRETRVGKISTICTEKDFEMGEKHMRKFKGRVCFDGRPTQGS